MASLLLSSCSLGYLIANGRFPPTEEEIRIEEKRRADAEVAAREERRRNEELLAHARQVEILEPAQLVSVPYKILGIATANIDPRTGGSGVLFLQIQAVQLGGNALTEIAHEMLPLGMATGSSSSAVVTPFFRSSVASSQGNTVTNVQYTERWTAKVILKQADS